MIRYNVWGRRIYQFPNGAYMSGKYFKTIARFYRDIMEQGNNRRTKEPYNKIKAMLIING